jgi:hypothetical protein
VDVCSRPPDRLGTTKPYRSPKEPYDASFIVVIDGVPLTRYVARGGDESATNEGGGAFACLSLVRLKVCNFPSATQNTFSLSPLSLSRNAMPETDELFRGVPGKGRCLHHGLEGWSFTRLKEKRPSGPAATTSSEAVMANCPIAG